MGFFTMVLLLFFYFRWKNRLFLYYFFLLFSLTLFLVQGTLFAYYSKKNLSLVQESALLAVDVAGAAGVVFSSFIIFYEFLKKSPHALIKYIFTGIPLALLLSIPSILIIGSGIRWSMTSEHSFFFMKIYMAGAANAADIFAITSFLLFSIALMIKSDVIGNGLVRKYTRAAIFIVFIFTPFLVIDSVAPLYSAVYVRLLHVPDGFESSTIMFFCGNSLSIYYFIKYVIGRLDIDGESGIPESLVKDYSITRREREIILFLLQNYSFNQIGSRLFISKRTVEKHVYNIYKKMNVSGKTELISLIRPA